MVRLNGPFGGQPVGFLVLAGAFVLEVEVERPIGVSLERHVTAHRETIERVPHLEAFRIVEGDRPESIHWRHCVLVEVEDVLGPRRDKLAGGHVPTNAVGPVGEADGEWIHAPQCDPAALMEEIFAVCKKRKSTFFTALNEGWAAPDLDELAWEAQPVSLIDARATAKDQGFEASFINSIRIAIGRRVRFRSYQVWRLSRCLTIRFVQRYKNVTQKSLPSWVAN
jgi:hypothetical protein